MNVIFTDIDGVLNFVHKNEWNRTAIEIYNRICLQFDLKAVISSTLRTNHSIYNLQSIFDYHGIEVDIIDYTPILKSQPRGVEIETWIREHNPDRWVVLDDNTTDILPFVTNVVKCRGWIGLSEEEYEEVKQIFEKYESSK